MPAEDEAPHGDLRDERTLGAILPVSVFLSGAVVMVLEVLGTRLIAPVYGTSLYVWSSLIAVTLLSLSVGYWMGGRVADRWPTAGAYFLLFEAAALLILGMPLLRGPVLMSTQVFGLRGGALAAALALVAAPLTVLGMVSPYAVRLRADLLTNVGATAGRLYALSTAGSLVGTLLAGFYLLPHYRVSRIFMGCAAVLVAPALTYQGIHARPRMLVGLAILALAGASIAQTPPRPRALRHVSESHFGQLKVVDTGNRRALLVNGATQSVVDRATGKSLIAYPPLLAKLAYLAKPDGESALVIGLGASSIPRLFGTWGVDEVVVVEIDPETVDVAERLFGFDRERTEVVVADGRQFLATTERTFDYIVLDAFAGEVVPAHLLTTEMVALVESHLRPDGLLLVNFGGCRTGQNGRPLRSIVRTIEAHLPWVRVYGVPPPVDCGSNLLVAAREPVEIREGRIPFVAARPIRRLMGVTEPLEIAGAAEIITDDYNPLDLWAVAGQEAWRRGVMTSMRPPILLAE